MKPLLSQLARFGGVGLVAMAVHFAVATGAMHGGLPPLAANPAGFLLAVPVSYYGHRRITFDRSGHPLRFLLTAMAGFAANELLYAALLRHTPLTPEAALLLTLGSVAVGSYLLCRCWAFPLARA